MKVLMFMLVFIACATTMSAQHYSGSHHTSSHGGTYSGGHGSSHRGGTYHQSNGAHHYGHHK